MSNLFSLSRVAALSLTGSLLVMSTAADAALLAHYDFTDSNLLDNEVGAAFTLTKVVTGADTLTITPEGAASFPGFDGGEKDYLQVAGPGGKPNWTVSFWIKTDTVNQGGFQGLFTNAASSTAANSWQIDVNNGTLRLVGIDLGAGVTNAEGGEPQLQAGVWHHVVARKTTSGSASAELFLDNQSLGTVAANPGGLQNFRLGANRNTDKLYKFEMANVKIYDDVSVAIATLNGEGPQLVPEPGSLALLGLGGLLLARRRRA